MDLSEADVREAASRLIDLLPIRQRYRIVDRSFTTIRTPRGRGLPSKGSEEAMRLAVKVLGSELLSDVKVRKSIVRNNAAIARKLARHKGRGVNEYTELAGRRWFRGGPGAKRFVRTAGLPDALSGRKYVSKPADLVELTPVADLPLLKDFQRNVRDQALATLRGRTQDSGMISLPTGAGKTRTALEALTLYEDGLTRGVMFWLATTQEVCEQAAQAYLALRDHRRPNRRLHLQRFWGTHELHDDFEDGFIVASVQKLHRRLSKEDNGESDLDQAIRRVRAIVFDEGHRSIAPTYEATIDYIRDRSIHPVSLLGLTATPGRGSDPEGRESKRLVRKYNANILRPRIKGWDDPVGVLQNRGILSHLRVERRPTNMTFELDERAMEHWNEFRELDSHTLQNIARNRKRNEILLNRIMEVPEGASTIVYSCTVEHAEFLATALEQEGRTAAAISAETRSALRHLAVDRFKDGTVEFLVNYGVLTTGFDAPGTNHIVLARPITSQVLYEQVVGRGLRGPKFGGTRECILLDFADNFSHHGRPLAYRRFLHLWEPGRHYLEREVKTGRHKVTINALRRKRGRPKRV